MKLPIPDYSNWIRRTPNCRQKGPNMSGRQKAHMYFVVQNCIFSPMQPFITRHFLCPSLLSAMGRACRYVAINSVWYCNIYSDISIFPFHISHFSWVWMMVTQWDDIETGLYFTCCFVWIVNCLKYKYFGIRFHVCLVKMVVLSFNTVHFHWTSCPNKQELDSKPHLQLLEHDCSVFGRVRFEIDVIRGNFVQSSHTDIRIATNRILPDKGSASVIDIAQSSTSFLRLLRWQHWYQYTCTVCTRVL